MGKVGTLRIFDPGMLGKEEQLLLACSQSSMDGEAILGARAILAQGIDWTRLLKMSDRLKVLLLVTYNLRRHLSDVIPRVETGRINRIVARAVAHSLFT